MSGKRLALGWVLLAIAAFCAPFFSKALAATSPWMSSPGLTLNVVREFNTGEPTPYSINGNRDCTERKIITRPGRLLPFPQTEQSHASCSVDTSYGAVSSSGYLQRQGTIVSGEARNSNGTPTNIIPVPRSDTAIHYSSGPVTGLYLYFTNGFGGTLKSSAWANGSVSHTSTQPITAGLKDKSGSLIAAHVGSLAFSANGQWMVVDSPWIGLIRVNLNTFEVLPFADTYNYNIGLAPGIQSAVSSDGRYAAQFSRSFGRFVLYDLSTCGAVPPRITSKVSCQSRDLYAFVQNKVPGFIGVGTIRFINNDALSLYIAYEVGSVTKIRQYVLSLPGAGVPNFEYLALGDSFASGEGAYQYKALTDTKDNKCHLSLRSYPYLIAQNLALNKYESVACSGAKILDIMGSKVYNDEKSQAKGKENDSYNQEIFSGFLPGYRAQNESVTRHSPNIVTISAVGNDIGFVDKIKRCLEPDTCFSTYEDRLEVVREANNQFDRLVEMYKQLKRNSLPQTKIYAIGYPQLAKPGGNCGLNVRLNDQETAFSRLLIAYLNLVIKQAANKAGVVYVDAENALNGHRLCEAITPDDMAVNGLTAGNDIIQLFGGPIGNESYHPNYIGQRLLAAAVQTQTNNFTLTMPTPNPTAQPPAESDSLPMLQAPKSGRSVQRVNYDGDIGNDIMYKQRWWQGTIDTAENAIPPLKIFTIWLRSSPVNLGSFTSDATGKLSFQVQVPSSVPAGFHTIHIIGNNVAGEPIDIYKSVYVAASETDYDGDGIANAQDPCVVIDPSNIDADQDGIDDGCDPLIDLPPLAVTPPVIDEPAVLGVVVDTPSGEIPLVVTVSDPPPEEEPQVQDTESPVKQSEQPQTDNQNPQSAAELPASDKELDWLNRLVSVDAQTSVVSVPEVVLAEETTSTSTENSGDLSTLPYVNSPSPQVAGESSSTIAQNGAAIGSPQKYLDINNSRNTLLLLALSLPLIGLLIYFIAHKFKK